MSLNNDELIRTARELQANLVLTGLTKSEVGVDLQLTPDRLAAALSSTEPSDPVDVWQLRDYLEQAVTDAGRTVVPFSVLTEQNRTRANGWFRLRQAPRHDYSQARPASGRDAS